MRLTIANKNYSSRFLRPWLLLRMQGLPFEERLLPFVAPAGGLAYAEMHGGFGRTREVCTMNCGLRVRVRNWTPAGLRPAPARPGAAPGMGPGCARGALARRAPRGRGPGRRRVAAGPAQAPSPSSSQH